MGKTFVRKVKETQPVLAVCYDFDKTLTPDDMQAQGYIQSVGYDTERFWRESNELSEQNDMDQNLAYMYKMVEEAQGHIVVTRRTLAEYGARVRLFPGVEEWFARVKRYGEEHGVIVEHYIISSGLKEMIEGTDIARGGAFERIYASSFYFDPRGVARWPAQVVNYTNKTQFLFRIEKGVLDINDPGVNEVFQSDEIRVPFRNMVYIGDSDTDIPCMRLVTANGGHAVGVYDPETGDRGKVYKMVRDRRIRYFAPADYREGSELDRLLRQIIERTAANERLESVRYCQQNEAERADPAAPDEREIRREEGIAMLEGSRNFATTHTAVAQLETFDRWSDAQRARLLAAAVHNQQIAWILGDEDVAHFFERLLEGAAADENAAWVRDHLAAARSERS